MTVDANELDFTSSDESCMLEHTHDPFKCKYGAKHLGIKSKVDWRQRIQHYKKVKERQKSAGVQQIEEHKEELKKPGILPDMKSLSQIRSLSQPDMGDNLTPKIFSTENYERIITEQQKAVHEVSPKLLAKLKSEEDLSRFFYDYKNMSISSSSLYKVGKTQDQLKEDKAVQMFFRKLVENAKLAKKPKNDELR